MSDKDETCCVCGKILPNRWAVGGRCAEKGCGAAFCGLHANQGNGQCPEHGWKEMVMSAETGSQRSEVRGQRSEVGSRESERAEERRLVVKATAELARKAMTETVALAGKIGAGVKGLWAKIHVDRSPEAMLGSLNAGLDENRVRREKTASEMEALHTQIASKKKAYESASPVRQRMLKTELQTLMTQYKSLEREFMLLSENEQTILTVKGRFMELIAHGLRGKVDEDLIDRLADDIEDKTGDAESVQDAVGDLDRAGRRRDRDTGDFVAELAGFGEDSSQETEDRSQNEGETEDRSQESEIKSQKGKEKTGIQSKEAE